MKPIITICAIFVSVSLSTAQQNAGIGTTTPDSTAILDLSSSSKGFLPPRLSLAQRDAIQVPATGLLIFNTTSNCMNYFDGSQWIELCERIGGGDTVPQGIGVVSALDYEIWVQHQNIQTMWGPNTLSINSVDEWDGAQNSRAIVDSLGIGNYAAFICDTLASFGYTDWYLPSKRELDAVFKQSYKTATLDFGYNSEYWSSTSSTLFTQCCAWSLRFYNADLGDRNKSTVNNIVCIRKSN